MVLENVKNLKSHDKGRTFQIIYDTLTRALGYQVHTKGIDARHVVPQHRERVFLVGFREPRYFEYPAFPMLWAYLRAYTKKHQDAGNGFGFVNADDTTRTLSARYHKYGSEILVSHGPGRNSRRLKPEFDLSRN